MRGVLGLLVVCLVTGLAAQACDSGGERPDLSGLAPDEQPSASGGSSFGGGGGEAPAQTVHLPFAVDDHFYATGYMGAAESGAVISNPNDCKERPEGAQGRCHCYEYIGSSEAGAWAGLLWLTGYENWGQDPGIDVDQGAHRISFHAASDPPGMAVQFVAGLESDLPYGDTFSRTLLPNLSTDLTLYSIDLSQADYTAGVLSGFGWVITGNEPGSLYIDDVRWE